MEPATPYTAQEWTLIRDLWDAANDDGIIQADAMLRIAPHDRPELHTTMNMGTAFFRLTGKEWVTEAVWARLLS